MFLFLSFPSAFEHHCFSIFKSSVCFTTDPIPIQTRNNKTRIRIVHNNMKPYLGNTGGTITDNSTKTTRKKEVFITGKC